MEFHQRLTIAVALVLGVFVLLASPAAAHTGFESSVPADGTVVDEPVDRIVVRFTGAAEPSGEGFVVLDAAGVPRTADTVTGSDDLTVWTLDFASPLAAGAVGVRWTVQAPDAHPIDGSFRFTSIVPAPPEETVPDLVAGGAAITTGNAESPNRRGPLDSTIDAESGGHGGRAGDGATATEPTAADPSATVDLDAFLSETDRAAPLANVLGAAGRWLGLTAAMLAIGATVFASTVLGDDRRERVVLLRLVRVAGGAIVLGAGIELVAQSAVVGGGWGDVGSANALRSTVLGPFGVAVGLRVLGGLLLVVGAATRVLPPTVAPATSSPALVAGPTRAAHRAADPHESALPAPTRMSPTLVLGVLSLLLSYSFDGHTVTEGNRVLTSIVAVVHVAGGAVWAGGVFALVGVLWSRHRRGVPLHVLAIAVRFSVVATAAFVATAIAGSALAVTILDAPADLWSTSWGRLLIAKLLAVALAAGLGAYHHVVVLSWLDVDHDEEARSSSLRATVTVEAVIAAVVIALTALLVAAAP